ncbi:MAG: hypothetical protein LBI82_02245 [Dysgonamonadaceae bacterium]|jgi:hypothetical protein|nr:hypothetical protein [Dysgonamonadaceae bacterium]
MKKITLVFILAITLVNTAIAETISTIDRDNPQSILYVFQRFAEISTDVIVDSLAKNGEYIVFEVFTDDDEKVVYGEEDYNPYDENIDENDPPEIWRSAYYLHTDINAINHEYTCVRNCAGNTQATYRLLPSETETKFLHYFLNYGSNVQCIGELDIYDFNSLTESFSLDTTVYEILDVSLDNFFKESTPDSLMGFFDYCFYPAYYTDKYIAQYRFRSYVGSYFEERKEELEKWMLGNVIDIYFINGKFVRSEPYFEDDWQWNY